MFHRYFDPYKNDAPAIFKGKCLSYVLNKESKTFFRL